MNCDNGIYRLAPSGVTKTKILKHPESHIRIKCRVFNNGLPRTSKLKHFRKIFKKLIPRPSGSKIMGFFNTFLRTLD